MGRSEDFLSDCLLSPVFVGAKVAMFIHTWLVLSPVIGFHSLFT